MRHILVIINLLFAIVSIAASGKTEIPQNYRDIGQLDLTKNKQYDTIFLPYIKPAGINKIITSSVTGLIIDKIMVDGKIIHPKRVLFDMGAYEATSYKYEQDVNSDEGQFLMPMPWGARYGSTRTYDEWLSEGIYFDYFSRNGKIKYSPDYYIIPYGSREAFIFYKIRFPDYSSSEELYIAKFNITWPEIRIADRNKRISPPSDYDELGLYEFNMANEIIIELPFQEINNPYVDSRWIEIYQLIGDGLVLNKQRLNSNERNNIDVLTEPGQIQEGKRIIEMKWKNDKNGIVFYSISENPPIKYIIPYGCKEIYMIYNIIFKKPDTIGTYIIYNKRFCVKWEITWD